MKKAIAVCYMAAQTDMDKMSEMSKENGSSESSQQNTQITPEMLEKLSKEYGVILIDTPPVNVVTDAMELAQKISGIVLVVRYGKTTNEDLDAAVKKMEFGQMNLFGFILNGVKTGHGGYYTKYKYKYKDKYYYKKGYGYGYYGGYGAKP